MIKTDRFWQIPHGTRHEDEAGPEGFLRPPWASLSGRQPVQSSNGLGAASQIEVNVAGYRSSIGTNSRPRSPT